MGLQKMIFSVRFLEADNVVLVGKSFEVQRIPLHNEGHL